MQEDKINQVNFGDLMLNISRIYSAYTGFNSSKDKETIENGFVMYKAVIDEFGSRINAVDIPFIITKGLDGKYNKTEGEINTLSPMNLKKWFIGFIYQDKASRYLKSLEKSNQPEPKMLNTPSLDIEQVKQIANEAFLSFKNNGNMVFAKSWLYKKLVEFNLVFIPDDVQAEIKEKITSAYIKGKNTYATNSIGNILSQHLANEEIQSKFDSACLDWYFTKLKHDRENKELRESDSRA